MTKEEIIDRASKTKTATVGEIVNWVKSMPETIYPINYKKGDVFTYNSVYKQRPYVIIKELKDTVIAIPMSTTNDELSTHPFKSRFFGNGFFSNQLMTFKKVQIETKFVGVLDDTRSVNKAFKLIKEYYNNI